MILTYFPILFKGWWNVAMAKKPDTYDPPGSRHHVNQGLKQQQHEEDSYWVTDDGFGK